MEVRFTQIWFTHIRLEPFRCLPFLFEVFSWIVLISLISLFDRNITFQNLCLSSSWETCLEWCSSSLREGMENFENKWSEVGGDEGGRKTPPFIMKVNLLEFHVENNSIPNYSGAEEKMRFILENDWVGCVMVNYSCFTNAFKYRILRSQNFFIILKCFALSNKSFSY